MPLIRTVSNTMGFFIPFVDLSYHCHILVITKLEKDILDKYQSVPNLKEICQTSIRYTRYIPNASFLAGNRMFQSYALHIPVPVPLNAAANEIQPVIELWFDFCIPLHSVHQAQAGQHDLFATGSPVGSFSHLRLGRRRGGPAPAPAAAPAQGATEDCCNEV